MLFYFACEAAGASRARHSLRPYFFRGRRFMHHSGAGRRGNAEVCAITTPVIARSESDEAIHLRSGDADPWIASLALAMTGAERGSIPVRGCGVSMDLDPSPQPSPTRGEGANHRCRQINFPPTALALTQRTGCVVNLYGEKLLTFARRGLIGCLA